MSLSVHERLSSPEMLAWIGERVVGDGRLSRYRLAKEVCERLAWRDGRGRLKEMACRKRLLRLEREGLLRLPAVRRGPPRPGRAGPAVTGPEVTGTLAELGRITLLRVTGGTAQGRLWNALMDAHHPQGAGPLVGEQLRYLIDSETQGVLGGLAFSAGAWRLAARDAYLGWDDATRRQQLPGVIANSRFLLLPTVRVKHLASHVLAQAARRLPADWQAQYGHRPWLLETYVEANRSGTAYRAANWIEVGMSAGRGRDDPTGGARLPRKRVFVYPLDRAALVRICGPRAAPEAGWVKREFGAVRLGDARLEKRLASLVTDFFARPQANVPQAAGSPAKAKAAYRFFQQERATLDNLLVGHRQSSIERMRRQPVVLAVQDSTSLNYTLRPGMRGIGPIGTEVEGAQGLWLHSTLAFSPDGTPLGLIDVQCWARAAQDFGKKARRHETPIEDKESAKWLRALEPTQAAQAQCPASRIVTVADRESDLFEFFTAARAKGLDLLVRAKENRALQDSELRLWPHLRAVPPVGEMEVSVPPHAGQPARLARLRVRFAPVTLAPPRDKPALAPLPVWVVYTREEAPPAGVKTPLEWMLLSTVAVESLEDALERVRWYVRRWGIEVFHRVLKSGCKIEDRQLGTDRRLKACLAIDLVVAWRIQYLTWLGRATPELPCTVCFEQAQWQALVVFKTHQPCDPHQPPTLREMLRLVASLGGHLGRKSDGEPGTQTLWRGLQRMDDITAAYRVFSTLPPLPPPTPPPHRRPRK